jgi:hypothetical protein
MGVYVYRVATNPIKTDLGFDFHQSFFCYKDGCGVDWNGNPSKWLKLTHARLDRVQETFDNYPDRWSGYIGEISKQPDGNRDGKMVIGTEVNIFKRQHGISSYYDIDDPAAYQLTIKKVGHGKWKQLFHTEREESSITIEEMLKEKMCLSE